MTSLATVLIIGAAVWRLSYGLVKQSGPLDAFAKLRAWRASKQRLSGGIFDTLSCVSCASMYVSIIPAIMIANSFFEFAVTAFALSGIATMIDAFMRD